MTHLRNLLYWIPGALYTLHSVVRISDNALFKNSSALTGNGGENTGAYVCEL